MKSMSEAGLRQAGQVRRFASDGPRLRLGAQRLALEERPRAVLHRRAVGRRASCAAGRASGPATSAASKPGPTIHGASRFATRSVGRAIARCERRPDRFAASDATVALGPEPFPAPGGRRLGATVPQEAAKNLPRWQDPRPPNPQEPAKMAGPGPRGSRKPAKMAEPRRLEAEKPAKMAGIGVRIDELARRCPCTTVAPEPPEGRAEEQVDLERGRRSGGRPVRRAWRIPGGLGFVACFQQGRAVGGRMPSRTRNRQRRSFKHEVKRRTGGRRGPEPNS